MADMKNVVKAIDICLGHGVCNDCPYCFSGKGYTTMNCRDYMMRDALALLKAKQCIRLFNEREYITRYTGDALQLIPDAMQELVRCKDCKHYDGDETCMKIGIAMLDGDWFCADGERRIDDA